jgi:formate/nitrite transporter FocA (FNT family)
VTEQHREADPELRDTLDTSRRGAPAAGEAVADIFSTDEIFHRIMTTADDEMTRTRRMLFLSGLAAGLSIGLTFLGQVYGRAFLVGWDPHLSGALLFPVGFVFIVLGRHQLFTENTLTPVTLVLTRLASVPRLLELWGIVYLANLVGATIAALLFAATSVLDPSAIAAARAIGGEAMGHSWSSLLIKAVIAGWMVAGMVWLVHAVRERGAGDAAAAVIRARRTAGTRREPRACRPRAGARSAGALRDDRTSNPRPRPQR